MLTRVAIESGTIADAEKRAGGQLSGFSVLSAVSHFHATFATSRESGRAAIATIFRLLRAREARWIISRASVSPGLAIANPNYRICIAGWREEPLRTTRRAIGDRAVPADSSPTILSAAVQ